MKRLVRIIATTLGLLALSSGSASAQSKDTTGTSEPGLISPLKIARAINRSRRAWSKNRVTLDIDLAPTWQRLKIDPGQFAGCAGDCEAKVFRHELNSAPGREVVLKLTQSFNFCRYLIFARARDNQTNRLRWKLLGHIDHDFNRYEMSTHRTALVNGRPHLVIRGQEGSGSGFALYAETWYQITDDRVKPVLYYPVAGHTYPWPSGLGRDFKARVLSVPAKTEVIIHYRVAYSTLDYVKNDSIQLAVNHHRARYSWSKQLARFVLDPARSDVSDAEVEAVANIQSEEEPGPGTKIGNTTFYSLSETKAFVGGGYDVFLKYNSRRLMKIASGRDAAQKQWLKQFLDDCEDTAEKRTLLQALQQ